MTHRSPFRASRLFAPALVFSAAAALLQACAPAAVSDDEAETEGDDESVAEAKGALLSGLPLFSLRPLAQEAVPQPIGGHITNQAAAVRLGKALFWDIQAGGDGQTACASCHFHAGADDRVVNTINPGVDGAFGGAGVDGPGQAYEAAFIESDDRVGSQGVQRALFTAVSSDPSTAVDECILLPAPPFDAERQVGFRHTPTVIGSVFFRNQFWGGEGNATFNGLNMWGFSGNNEGGASIAAVQNASLASQATQPSISFMEMSCFGRPMNGENSLAQKMLARAPLQFQRVATDDSVLGALANPAGPGLRCGDGPCSYGELIAAAFGPETAADAENLFSLVWGEAIQAYESTLVPDQTPFDRFLAGDLGALTLKQVVGLAQFVGKGKCVNCHLGPMLSDATVSAFETRGPLNRDGGDLGFHNIGLRPTDEDLARGDVGIFGGVPNSVSGSPFDRGAFKTSTLRNVKLTAPYFHTGGVATLEGVVDFYDRGGDFDNPEKSSDITPRGFTALERKALVDFLANGLTDCRVEKERAPFDHPELPVPNRETVPAVGKNGLGKCK